MVPLSRLDIGVIVNQPNSKSYNFGLNDLVFDAWKAKLELALPKSVL